MRRAWFVLVLLALTVGAAAAACGNDNATPTPSLTVGPTPVPTPVPTPSPAVAEPTPVPAEIVTDMAEVDSLASVTAAAALDLQAGGASVATGDFNGDGVDDLLLGASFADGPNEERADAGEAYVFLGPLADRHVNLAQDSADVVIYGALANDNLGNAVIAGDLNGDGVDDIIAGAPGSNALENIRTDLGEAYVIFGGNDLPSTIDLLNEEQDFTFRPAEGFTRVGTTFAVADMNLDGIDDLIAGGPFGGRDEGSPVGSPRLHVGEVYVVFGRSGLSGELDMKDNQPDIRLKGEQGFDNFGYAVGAGDVNGDGRPDIVVSAKLADGPAEDREDAGELFVFYGSDQLTGLVMSTQADVRIVAAETKQSLGDVIAVEDMNGDGRADIAASARMSNGPDGVRPLSGGVYIIFSGDLPAEIDLADGPDALVYGRESNDFGPSSLLVTGGGANLVVGVGFGDGADGFRRESGEAYVIPTANLSGTIDLRSDVEGVPFIYGPVPRARFGQVVIELDADGDGTSELAILAPGPGEPSDVLGALYVIPLPQG